MNSRRLYRSRTDRQLAGVAGGMAEYLELDPTLVRVLWILSVFLGGFTLLAYVILAFVVPLAPGRPVGSWSPPGGGTAEAGDAATTTELGVAPDPEWQPGAPGTGDPGWTGWGAPGAPGAVPPASSGRSGPNLALGAGILLIVFGLLALGEALVPALAGARVVGPAMIVTVGALLLASALRREPRQS